MLRFFRKMRNDLLTENRFVRYFFYAFGDILLVVIGILIALQINSIKKDHDDRLTEIMVLQALKEDLVKDTIDLNRVMDYKKDQVHAARSIMRFFVNPNETVTDTAEFLKNLSFPYYVISDYPNKTAFEMAKSPDSLFAITDESLVNVLAAYFSFSDLSNYLTETKWF